MAVREAVRLTMQAAAIGRAGETLVLDMGSPVRVLDIAEQMIESSRRSVEIRITGLRPGEKMHEVLLGLGEEAERPFHPMIDHVRVDPLDLVIALDRCAEHGVQPLTAEGLRHIAHLPAEQSIPGAPAETPEPDPRDAS
jgi:FlaA1/EpsC-like NDP-sugar epimerase